MIQIYQTLIDLHHIYLSNFCTHTENTGHIEPTHPITWEPYLINKLVKQNPDINKILKDYTPYTLQSMKLILTFMYLSQGYSVIWNHRINRSTHIHIYVPALNTGFYIPDTNTESYAAIKDYRRRRLSHKLKGLVIGPKIYILTLEPSPSKYNHYWKSLPWLKEQMKES